MDPLQTILLEARADDGTVTVFEVEKGSVEPVVRDLGPRRAVAAVATDPLRTNSERYDPRRVVGKGGFAHVVEATDRHLERVVAIKRGHSSTGQEVLVREGLLTAGLQHPHIVPVYDVETGSDGTAFYTMKLLEGRSLKQIVREIARGCADTSEQFPRSRMLADFRRVCLAVHYAHRQGVLHRDIKPANIMVGQFGEVVLADWGLAARIEELAGENPDVIRGTPAYMAPELFTGDGRGSILSDVYALGACLHELLTLAPPRSGSLIDMVRQAQLGEQDYGRLERLDVPEELVAICKRALALQPGERPQSAELLANQISAHLDRQAERSRRLARAQQRFVAAHAEYLKYTDASAKIEMQSEAVSSAEAALPGSASRDERRVVWGLQRELEAARVANEAQFGSVVQLLESVLEDDAQHRDARALLSDLYWTRFTSYEEAGDRVWTAYFEQLVRKYDDGRYARRLARGSVVSLECRSGACTCRLSRYEAFGPLLEPKPVDRRDAARSHSFTLSPGSYLAELEAPGCAPTRIPFVVARAEDLSIRFQMYPDAAVPAGMVVVPYEGGDFAIGQFPVTTAEYLEYVNQLPEADVSAALPRVSDDGPAYFEYRDGRWELPAVDPDGDTWELQWPIVLISGHQADRYAERQGGGFSLRLPSVEEWTWAAQGADGRRYPWGNRFEVGCAALREGNPNVRAPFAIGEFSDDQSPFGVRDMCGGVIEWTRSSEMDTRTLKGASFRSWAEGATIATVRHARPHERLATNGFRLSQPLAGALEIHKSRPEVL